MNKKEIIAQKDRKLTAILQDFGFSFADVNKILRNGDAKIDGKASKKDVLVNGGQKVTVYFSDNMLAKKYEVVFEGENVLVVYKNAGIEADGENGLSSVLGVLAVHRLDRNTEGLMIFAKNEKSQKILEKAIKNRSISKFYEAEVVGRLEIDKTCDAFLVKDAENSFVKIYSSAKPNSVKISTRFKTIKAGQESSLIEVELLTGKTHQIRAHLAYLGHPIVGDGKYGQNEVNKKFHATRQKLCCYKLKFGFVGIEEVDFMEFEKHPKWAYMQP